MKEQAKTLSKEQRKAVAQYISQKLLRLTVMPIQNLLLVVVIKFTIVPVGVVT